MHTRLRCIIMQKQKNTHLERVSKVIKEQLANILKDIQSCGGKPYYVGGYVRDKFMGIGSNDIESKDIDIEVFHMTYDRLVEILQKYSAAGEAGKTVICGRSFKVVRIDNIDFSIPRSDKKVGDGHTGFAVEENPEMSE